MAFVLRILGLVLAATLVFEALAVSEQWQLFYGAFFGQGVGEPLPEQAVIESAIRHFGDKVGRNEVAGVPGSPAHAAAQRDLDFRSQRGIEQTVTLLEVSVQELYWAGPASVAAKAMERSHLRVRRPDGAPHWYELSGLWTYTLVKTDSGWGIFDALPHGVDLIPSEAREPSP